MCRFILMCGLSHSGKSFLAQKIANKINAAVISLDDINEERGLDSNTTIPVEEWEKTHGIALERLNYNLKRKMSVIIDDTNPLKMLRNRFKNVADKHDVDTTIVYVNTPDSVISKRIEETNNKNNRHLAPLEELEKLKGVFEYPEIGTENLVTYDFGVNIEDWLDNNF